MTHQLARLPRTIANFDMYNFVFVNASTSLQSPDAVAQAWRWLRHPERYRPVDQGRFT